MICCSVAKSYLTLCDPTDWSTPGFPVPHHLPELVQTHIHWVGDAIQPSHPLLPTSPAPIFPSIRVFSSASTLHIRWPKYWSFSFNISPSNEYPELISFRIDWFDLLAVQGTFKTLLQNHNSKASILWFSDRKHLILHVVTIKTLLKKRNRQVFPGGPVRCLITCLPMQGTWVWFLLGELRSHMLWSN